jgi:hypothetical protein
MQSLRERERLLQDARGWPKARGALTALLSQPRSVRCLLSCSVLFFSLLLCLVPPIRACIRAFDLNSCYAGSERLPAQPVQATAFILHIIVLFSD